MNITILTKTEPLYRLFSEAVEAVILNKRLFGMELYSFQSPDPKKLTALLPSSEMWLIFLDADSYPAWNSLAMAFAESRRVLLCLISCSYANASRLINCRELSGVAGYINPLQDQVSAECEKLLEYLSRKIRGMNSHLLLRRKGKEDLVPFSTIYYIETEKGTHMCTVFCNGEQYTVRANIKSLFYQLDKNFFPVRSSTIANLSNVRRFDTVQAELYFAPDVSCTCTRRNKKYLTDYFREKS